MTAPDFIAQSAEPMTSGEVWAWFRARSQEMHERGATWLQHAVDDADDPKIFLVEGWRDRPEEQPVPHFQKTYLTN